MSQEDEYDQSVSEIMETLKIVNMSELDKYIITAIFENITNDIKTHSKFMITFLFNILLVHKGARKSYLLETSGKSYNECSTKIDKIINEVGLIKVVEDQYFNHPRYFIHKQNDFIVPKNHKEVGEALGFITPSNNYSNSKSKQLVHNICEQFTNVYLFTEIVDMTKIDIDTFYIYQNEKLVMFNNICEEHNLPFNFNSKIIIDDGTIIREQELKNLNVQYIIQNMNVYLNDINNVYSSTDNICSLLFSIFITNNMKHKDLYDMFNKLYKMMNNDIDHHIILHEIDNMCKQIISLSLSI